MSAVTVGTLDKRVKYFIGVQMYTHIYSVHNCYHYLLRFCFFIGVSILHVYMSICVTEYAHVCE